MARSPPWIRRGRSSFQLLQAYEIGEQSPPLIFYAFDLLFLDGADLRKQPLVERRKRLVQAPEEISRQYPVLRRVAGPQRKASGGCTAIRARGLNRQKTGVSLRERSAQWRMGKIQDHQSPRVYHRRLHPVSIGSNRFWSPRSNLRSGPTTTSFGNLCSSDYGLTNRPRM